MLHAGYDFLSYKTPLLEMDAMENIHGHIMGKHRAECEVHPAFGNTEMDPVNARTKINAAVSAPTQLCTT